MNARVPAIRVRHLWHRFGNRDVLRDVSFEVGHGEIFGFIGPNGAGKTTTIRIMATLLEPMAGRVEIDGIDVALDPDRVRRMVGYMPDHAGVYERITVREFLEFFADAYGVSEPTVVDAVIELTDLQKLDQRLVVELSKG
ncbi:MAG TPA: ABC transporter ATP-binding protein, partial [Polyangiaceae bacterium]